MHYESSPGSSPSKSPLSISPSRMASPTCSLYTTFGCHSTSTKASSCAYPSWPTGSSLGFRNNVPSAFISDEDLFGDADEYPFLTEAPAPPRQPQMPTAVPVLPPLYAPKRPKNERRRSSGKKVRRTSKPMTPISESPEQVE